ncbi:MAG: hypothetical protein HY242_15260 [Afipia sp.]|nr:hypothetical protein [Afipia sp.]
MNRPARAASAWIGAIALALLMLVGPVLWNRYPLLQYDTGGYLARWYEGYLVPSRSTVFGMYLNIGEGFHFWPEMIVQSGLTIWIAYLTLRVFGLARPILLLAAIAVLSVITTLPWLTSILLTDIFAGLSVLALYLFLFRAAQLKRWEKIALLVLIAFSAATHSATLAVLLAIVGAAALLTIFLRDVVRVRQLIGGAAAIATGALMLLAANFALSGKLAWTPGGFGILFGRMLQDGIVTRYLNDHCPNAQLRLCPYKNELPETADEFLWEDGPFQDLGRFEGLNDEMRAIVLHSLTEYPGQQIKTAIEATLKQLSMVGTGAGVNNRLSHTYGIMGGYMQSELPSMRAARQQRGEMDFTAINRLHVPVALMSMALALLMLGRILKNPRDDLALLAGTIVVATLSNAAVCAVLSGPHDRYGARIAWLSTFVVIVAVLRLMKAKSARNSSGIQDGSIRPPLAPVRLPNS